MQEEPRQAVRAAPRGARAVDGVARDGMAQGRQVDPDLVGPAGDEVHFQEGPSTEALANPVPGDGWPSVGDHGHPGPLPRIAPDRRLDPAGGRLYAALNQREVRLLYAARLELRHEAGLGRVKKTYLALVQGSVESAAGRIEAPIGRDPRQRTRMAVVPDGRPSVTGYRVRERFRGWTLLEVDLVTGRTHQIRVHLAALGHAVAGDPVYGTGTSRRGPDGLERLFLHAWRIVFASPATGDLVRVEAPLPEELEPVLGQLRAIATGAPGTAGPDAGHTR